MKISRQTREIINMVIFVLVAALLIVTYVVYPLNRTKAIMGRYNLDDYNEDSLAVNDPAVWTEALTRGQRSCGLDRGRAGGGQLHG
jgi:hypothetical protein